MLYVGERVVEVERWWCLVRRHLYGHGLKYPLKETLWLSPCFNDPVPRTEFKLTDESQSRDLIIMFRCESGRTLKDIKVRGGREPGTKDLKQLNREDWNQDIFIFFFKQSNYLCFNIK